MNETLTDASPWFNPKAPSSPKPWLERKKELDTTLWPDIRNLATIGHKVQSKTLGTTGLLQYHVMLQTPREEVKKIILEHEFKLGWLLPPEPSHANIELAPQSLGQQEMSSAPNSLVEFPPIPESQPQPPPVPGRKRRSAQAQQVAPPPIPINTQPLEVQQMAIPQLQISLPVPTGVPMQTTPSTNPEVDELRKQLAKLQDSADRIGKMLEAIGNNGDTHYKLSNAIASKVGETDKKLTLLVTALHHIYMADPNVLALLQSAEIDPYTVKTVGDFLAVMAKFAGVQYP